MDRRGRGASGDTQPYAIEREYEDVAAVVDAIDQPVSLLGHSTAAWYGSTGQGANRRFRAPQEGHVSAATTTPPSPRRSEAETRQG